ncbi:hypothetical protein EH196_06995 [Bacillus sp. C1-1]|nr:hypothetical protein EH196_06995 [Bacillus sp. C1-1]
MSVDIIYLSITAFGGVIVGFILNLITELARNRIKITVQYESLGLGAYHNGIEYFISEPKDANCYIWKTNIVVGNLGNRNTAVTNIYVEYYEDPDYKEFERRIFPKESMSTKFNLEGNALNSNIYTFEVENEDIGKESSNDINGIFVRNYFEYYAVIKVELINGKIVEQKVDFGGKATAVEDLSEY